jgi:hypothetical protein
MTRSGHLTDYQPRWLPSAEAVATAEISNRSNSAIVLQCFRRAGAGAGAKHCGPFYSILVVGSQFALQDKT